MTPERGLLGRPRVRTVQLLILHGRVPVRQGVSGHDWVLSTRPWPLKRGR